MGVKDTFKKIIGIEEIDDDEVTEEDIFAAKESLKKEKAAADSEPAAENKTQKPPFAGFESSASSAASSPKTERSKAAMSDKKFTVGSANKLKVIVIEPKNIVECQKLVDNLRANKPVIINLEKLERDTAKQIYDFMLGAIYALNGSVSKIANNIIMFAPNNVSIDQQIDNKQPEKVDENNLWGSNN